MSRPIVVTVCIDSSSESWELYQPPLPWHSRAGGGAVHSIMSRHMQCSKSASFSAAIFETWLAFGAARYAHRKYRALARLARHGHVAAHHACEPAADGEAQAS